MCQIDTQTPPQGLLNDTVNNMTLVAPIIEIQPLQKVTWPIKISDLFRQVSHLKYASQMLVSPQAYSI